MRIKELIGDALEVIAVLVIAAAAGVAVSAVSIAGGLAAAACVLFTASWVLTQ